MAIDPLGLKEGGKITHFIDTMSAAKIGIAMFTSSLAVALIMFLLKQTKK